METDQNLQPENKELLGIVTKEIEISLEILRQLKGKQCFTKIVSDDVNSWQNIFKSEMLSEVTSGNFINSSPRYLIVNNYLLDFSFEEVKQILNNNTESLKKFILLPYSVNPKYQEDLVNKFRELQQQTGLNVIFLGDLVNEKFSSINNVFVNKSLIGDISNFSLTEKFYPVGLESAAKNIVKQIFSLSLGKEIALVSSPKDIKVIKRFLTGGLKVLTSVESPKVKRSNPSILEVVNIDFDLKTFLEQVEQLEKSIAVKAQPAVRTVDALPVGVDKLPEPLKARINIPKTNLVSLPRRSTLSKTEKPLSFMENVMAISRKNRVTSVHAKIAYLTALLIFFFPFLVLLVSFVSTYLSIYFINEGNLALAKNTLQISRVLSSTSRNQLNLYQSFPYLGKIFDTPYFISKFTSDGLDVAIGAIGVGEKAKEVFSLVTGKEMYDVGDKCEGIQMELEKLYQDVSFIQSEINSAPPLAKSTVEYILKEKKIGLIREKLYYSSEVFRELPDILGEDVKKSYLVLLQNNMEIRPTGGFIGSFALVSFQGGRMVDVSVHDVYEADGQLKGFVEAPEPLKKYLNQSGWYLRESNWDPDFLLAAKRAEWFLEKEIDKKVDGVFAVDLEVAKEILKTLGPLYLADYSMNIDHNNMYEVTQSQVESDFFPGSQKKRNFLGSLSKEMLNRLTNVRDEQVLPLGKSLYKSLEEKHFQIYLHNSQAQKAVSALGFDGAVVAPQCSEPCYSDWFSLVEANLGINKANYFISKKLDYSFFIKDNKLTRTLKVTYYNGAGKGLGDKGTYKTYTRLLTPKETTVKDILSLTGAKATPLEYEETGVDNRKEIGVYYEIKPGENKEITFIWEHTLKPDYERHGEYKLLVRKQPGTQADPLSLQFKLPVNAVENGDSRFSLTLQGLYSYNTNLARDFSAHFIW